jgi:hypothetical protein
MNSEREVSYPAISFLFGQVMKARFSGGDIVNRMTGNWDIERALRA